jgi:hypothetical protein
VHAPEDQLEQIAYVAAALLRADCMVVRLMAPLERDSSFLDYSILGGGQDC